MLHLWLVRYQTSDQGTLGRLVGPNINFFTIELPWRQNAQMISCIPHGDYECFHRWSNKFNYFVYQLKNVKNRYAIQMHSGNVAGDKTLGFKSHSLGCILPGMATGILYGQTAVFSSKPTLALIMSRLQNQGFTLTVTGVV